MTRVESGPKRRAVGDAAFLKVWASVLQDLRKEMHFPIDSLIGITNRAHWLDPGLKFWICCSFG